MPRLPTLDVLGTPVGASGPFGQAWAAGCARMQRGEGIWHHAGKVYVVDTAAGGAGCVWELTLATQRIKALYVSHDQRGGNHVDKHTVSPRGGLICCEDGGGSDDGSLGSGNRLVGLTAGGAPYLFAKNNLDFSAAQYAAAGKPLADGRRRPAQRRVLRCLLRPDGALSLRQHPDPRHHLRHHRAVGEGQPVGVAAQ